MFMKIAVLMIINPLAAKNGAYYGIPNVDQVIEMSAAVSAVWFALLV